MWIVFIFCALVIFTIILLAPVFNFVDNTKLIVKLLFAFEIFIVAAFVAWMLRWLI